MVDQLAEIKAVFDLQSRSSIALRKSTAADRISRLRAIERHLSLPSTIDQLCTALHSDLGKSRSEAMASEIMVAVHAVRYIRKNLASWMLAQPKSTPLPLLGTSSYVHRESKGSVLIMSPWNYPFQLAINPLVYAVAAGCTFILKPSEYSTATSAVLRDMVEALFDKSEGSVFLGGVETAQRLLSLPFDHIYFTGSPAVGKIVMTAAAQHLSSITLELGGKSPCIIDHRTNIKKIARRLVWAKLYNNGQTCIAPDHVYVPRSMQHDLIDAVLLAVKHLYGDGPLVDNQDYGHIISDKHYQRILHLLDDASSKGATIQYIGGQPIADKLTIPLSIVTDVDDSMLILQEELFAPILPIIPYDDIQEVIDRCIAQPKPLAMYLMSSDRRWVKDMISNTTAGTTVVNDFLVQYANHHLPFGGVNNSGIGKSHGIYGYLAMTNERAILKQHLGITTLVHPPYTSIKERLVSMLMRWMG